MSPRARTIGTVSRRRKRRARVTAPSPANLLAQLEAQTAAVADQHRDAKAPALHLRYEQLPAGRGVRVTSPDLPGWATIARTPADFGKVLDAGWRELAVLAYARRRGEAYDLAHHADPPPLEPTTGRRYPERHPIEAWEPLPGGEWRSPSGRVYDGDSWQAKRVAEKRADAGLPTTVTDTSEAP